MKTLYTAIILLVCMHTSVAFSQSEVFLFGQLVNVASSSRIREVTALKTNTHLVSISTTTNPTYNGKIVAYNNSTRVQISTITRYLRHISASITSGEIPNGSQLSLFVIQPTDNYNGESEVSATEISLNRVDKVIVSEIGTCYSGKNKGDGFGLEYTLSTHSSLHNFDQKTKMVTVTLTIASEV